MKPTSVAFIPARSGSKRVPNKNIRDLGGHPLLAYSIISAIKSNVFDAIICATDCEEYASIARYYGAEVPFLRPLEISGDKSPDIEWVIWMLKKLRAMGRNYDIFSILRPTSPFRLPTTIQRAWVEFKNEPQADSLRAIEKCKQHPGKMWTVYGRRMQPLFPFCNDEIPWHSSQYSALPIVYSQNASLEIAWTKLPLEQYTIAGQSIIPFISNGLEGFDINQPEDWVLAEYYIKNNPKNVNAIDQRSYYDKS
jgi:N-acylneuraminate cytidylyltransferase